MMDYLMKGLTGSLVFHGSLAGVGVKLWLG